MPTNAAINQTFGHHYEYTLPAGYNWQHVTLVAFVKKAGSVKTDRTINNAIDAKLTVGAAVVATDIKEIKSALSSLQLAPNPASSYMNLKAELVSKGETKMQIINSIGQTVMTKSYTGTTVDDKISVETLTNGVYYMTFTSDAGTTSEKFIVNKQ